MKYKATITRITKEAADIVTLYFTIDGSMYGYEAGQYIAVYASLSGSTTAKAYSLSSAPHEPEGAITVKAIGAMSNYLCSRQPGDILTISSPFGFFNVQSNDPIVAIAAGVGLAPIWSIMKDELKHAASREITLFHIAPYAEQLVFSGVIKKLLPNHNNLTYHPFITREDVPGSIHRRFTVASDIAPHMVQQGQFYVCGSETFVRDIWQQLMQAGVDESRVVTETFFERVS